MFFFLSFNKCWPTLFLAHFIILEVQLSESSFHILLYVPIYLTKFNFIFHFCTLKKMEKWNYFWCKTKEFLLTKWILDLTLSTIFFILLFFCWIQNYNCPLHCRTVYILWFCSLFFNVEQTYSAVFVRNFLLLCYFWMITWLLMTFVDLFLLFLFLSLDLIFFLTFCSNLPLSIVFAINSISQASPFWGLFGNVFAYNFFCINQVSLQ